MVSEQLQSGSAERVRDFYRDFYRADRMAVIAVGDFDPAAMEALIRTQFSGLPTLPPTPRPVYPVPPHQDTRYVVVSDREAQGSSVSIIHKHPASTYLTTGDYRRSMMRGLVQDMVSEVFRDRPPTRRAVSASLRRR